MAGPAREPALGADPQAAVGGGGHVHHAAVGQAAPIAGHGHVTLKMPVGKAPGQAAAGGAKPQAAVGGGGDRPDRVAAQGRGVAAVVEGKGLAVAIQHRDPGVLRAHPQPVVRVHVQRPDQVVAQAVLAAPDAKPAAVIAGQAIVGGHPQIAQPVFGKGVDPAAGQAVGHPHLARLRGQRHGRPGHAAPAQQAPQQQSSCPHLPFPHGIAARAARSAPHAAPSCKQACSRGNRPCRTPLPGARQPVKVTPTLLALGPEPMPASQAMLKRAAPGMAASPGKERGHRLYIERPVQLTAAAWIAQHRHTGAIARFQGGVLVDEHTLQCWCARPGQHLQRQVAQVAVIALVEDQGHAASLHQNRRPVVPRSKPGGRTA